MGLDPLQDLREGERERERERGGGGGEREEGEGEGRGRGRGTEGGGGGKGEGRGRGRGRERERGGEGEGEGGGRREREKDLTHTVSHKRFPNDLCTQPARKECTYSYKTVIFLRCEVLEQTTHYNPYTPTLSIKVCNEGDCMHTLTPYEPQQCILEANTPNTIELFS